LTERHQAHRQQKQQQLLVVLVQVLVLVAMSLSLRALMLFLEPGVLVPHRLLLVALLLLGLRGRVQVLLVQLQ
jgi:hypothetical protein